MESGLTRIITRTLINDILNVYRDSALSTRYYNEPPQGGYNVNEEYEYILPDNDDVSSAVLLEIVTRFGSPETESFMKSVRRDQIKNIGKYKKIKKDDDLCTTACPICIEEFKENEFCRTLTCSHSFHKRCIDHWFRKDHSDCPMCRAKIL